MTPEERLKRIAAWYVANRNDEGTGYAALDGMFEMLGMTQQELTAAYLADERRPGWEEAYRQYVERSQHWEDELGPG